MTGRRQVLPAAAALLVAAIAWGVPDAALADTNGQECTVGALSGLYVFSATGYLTPGSNPAQPKAILELIRFNGDGTLGVPGATLSLNGAISRVGPGGTGTYFVGDLVPAEAGCAAGITFSGGPTFDVFLPPTGDDIWMIQTNPNNVFQGTARKVSP